MKRITFIAWILGFCFALQPLFAKDMPSISFSVGAIGAEKTLSQSSTLGDSTTDYGTVTVPYSKTTFNPAVQLALSVPFTNVTETMFFGTKIGYAFSWQGEYVGESSLSDTEMSTRNFTHILSVLPELTYTRDNFRFTVGSGVAVAISAAEYVEKYRGTTYSGELTQSGNIYQFIWMSDLEAKYYLSNHVALFANLSLGVSFYTMQRDLKYTMRIDGATYASENGSDVSVDGESPLFFYPHIGICYTF